MTLELPQVTLVCVDTREPALAHWALVRCAAQARFGEVLLCTRPGVRPADAPPGLRTVPVVVDSIEAYSTFMLRGLADHLRTSHALVIQWDGLVRDALAWRDEFLSYDYIGAPWAREINGQRVGNGGFSLRSRQLLEALRDPELQLSHPEDVCICVHNRPLLQSRHGVRFAPLQVATRFAYERVPASEATFGFHGFFNFWREMGETELHRFVTALPAHLCVGLDAHDLCEALIAHGRLLTARRIVDKRWQLGMRDRRTWRLRWRLWRAGLTRR
jgi:hypothetical protein